MCIRDRIQIINNHQGSHLCKDEMLYLLNPSIQDIFIWLDNSILRYMTASHYSKIQLYDKFIHNNQGPILSKKTFLLLFFLLLLPHVLCVCLLYTSPSPRDKRQSRMPSSA
eukprot:TRINITY_DN3348_c0_g1_i1.p2 TRINITY_DN3348_c0_g1~~TRINITY_DN3348_c0_g1_i1.p2  ORF type:complete len:111 (+),score=28.85 TRINITY_DN3348_c0_g1_i1:64-396(+)